MVVLPGPGTTPCPTLPWLHCLLPPTLPVYGLRTRCSGVQGGHRRAQTCWEAWVSLPSPPFRHFLVPLLPAFSPGYSRARKEERVNDRVYPGRIALSTVLRWIPAEKAQKLTPSLRAREEPARMTRIVTLRNLSLPRLQTARNINLLHFLTPS